MAGWLVKSEPSALSFADLMARASEPWSGVRNHQARRYLQEMRCGDGVLFYHSSCPLPAIVGLAEVVAGAYPDPSQFDPASRYFDPRSTPEAPRWWAVDLRAERPLRRALPLCELRLQPDLAAWPLLRRGNRLSVLPVPAAFWQRVLELEGLEPPLVQGV